MKIMSSFAPSCHDLYDWYYSVEHRREMSKCFVHTMDVNDNQNCLVTNILQNIYFLHSAEERKSYKEFHEGK